MESPERKFLLKQIDEARKELRDYENMESTIPDSAIISRRIACYKRLQDLLLTLDWLDD